MTTTKSLRIKGILCLIEQDEHGFFDVHIAEGNEPKLYPERIIREALDEKNAIALAKIAITHRLRADKFAHV